jgi:hypothetical protein
VTTSDRPRPAAPAAPPPALPDPDLPLGAQGGFPPPPPLDEPSDDPATGTEPAAGTNPMAVLGLVFAFVVAPLGVVFSAVGLVQTRRRGQPGRRLAVAGLVVALALTAVGVVLLATLGPPARPTVGPPHAGAATSAPVPAGNPADEAVAAACATVMPAMTRLEGDLAGAGSPDEVAAGVTALQQQVAAAAAASGDAGFAAHARALAADIGRLVDAARAGSDPAALVGAVERDGTALGRDCGSAGWLP